MDPILASPTSVLTLTNVIMGAGCLVAVAVVVVGVVLDLRDRRRWKAMVPDGWPPPGTEAEDAARSAAVPPPSSPSGARRS